ncbi:unnamed protein product [Gordionus sp. m RMFG-2023]
MYDTLDNVFTGISNALFTFYDERGTVVIDCSFFYCTIPAMYRPTFWLTGTVGRCTGIGDKIFYTTMCINRKNTFCMIDHCGKEYGEECQFTQECKKKASMFVCVKNKCSCPIGLFLDKPHWRCAKSIEEYPVKKNARKSSNRKSKLRHLKRRYFWEKN